MTVAGTFAKTLRWQKNGRVLTFYALAKNFLDKFTTWPVMEFSVL